MRIAIRIIQIIVGLLFIVSGLVKANDPMGLSYKMQEFFEIWNISLNSSHFFASGMLVSLFDFLHLHSLFLSILMITLEIMAGIALLIGWKKNLVLYSLLFLIIFFSFLTGYAFLSRNVDGSPKFTNCGCFGDCLPITPLTSFTKDIALLVMIIILILGKKYILPVLSKKFRTTLLVTSLIISLAIQFYVLTYLPLADCLPFKKGNNIAEQTKPPKNSIPDVFETRLVYRNINTNEQKDMSQDEFNNSKIWEDSTWEWKETKTKLIKKGNADPALKGFSLFTLTDVDSTEAILNYPGNLILYFVNPGAGNSKPVNDDIYRQARQKNIPFFVVTTNPDAFTPGYVSSNGLTIFKCDGTVFRTAARVNPTIYLLEKGTVKGKWPLARIKEAENTINQLKQ